MCGRVRAAREARAAGIGLSLAVTKAINVAGFLLGGKDDKYQQKSSSVLIFL